MLYKPPRLNQDNGPTLPAHTGARGGTVECAELVALDVFQHAEQTGQLVTLGQLERTLAELLALPGHHARGWRFGPSTARLDGAPAPYVAGPVRLLG